MRTLMIRNIPADFTQDMLLEEWPNNGTYDFLYLPLSSKGASNLTYAFVNFVSEGYATRFRSQWRRRTLSRSDGRKHLNISYAVVQGLEANLRALKQKPARRLRARKSRPYILIDGQQVELDDIE